MLDKDEIRRTMRERRWALTPEARKATSEIICAKLAADYDIGLRVDPLDRGSPIAVYLASLQAARTLGAESGDIRDSRRLSTAMQIATGGVTLELPKIGAKDHTRYRYYLRITQKMKGGRRFSWSYRFPLK